MTTAGYIMMALSVTGVITYTLAMMYFIPIDGRITFAQEIKSGLGKIASIVAPMFLIGLGFVLYTKI